MKITKRLNQKTAVKIENYFITFKSLKNTEYGVPRYEITVLNIESGFNAVYTIVSDHSGYKSMAETILKQYKKDCLQ